MHNVREYIVECRKRGVTDSVIVDNLKESHWPKDILDMAFLEANDIVPEVVPKEVQTQDVQTSTEDLQQQSLNKSVQEEQQINKKELEQHPTQLAKEQYDDSVKVTQKEIPDKKKFSFMSIVALILSPIPFVGLGVAMTTLDTINKKKMSGRFIAIIAYVLAIASIGIVVYALYQIFTLDPEKMTGFALFVNEKFGLV